MPANYELLDAFGQLMREKSVDKAVLIETLEAGLLSAARRKYGASSNVEVKFDDESGTIKMALIKSVVEKVEEPQCEMNLEAAKAVDPKAQIGSTVSIPLSIVEFGRNAIQAAKQVLIQRVREAERDKVFEIYHGKIGALVTGTVQQVDRGNVIMKLDRAEAILPGKEMMRRDRYRQGDHARAVVLSVDKSAKGPQVTLSRTRSEFVQRLFEGEVPEIAEGIVEIKVIAREAGSRSKVSVSSNDDKVDAVGACVGIKGTRVQSIVRELGGERIDVISWSADPTILASRSLSPAKISRVVAGEGEDKLTVVVGDDQLSLAIGKGGQNARLAARLVGRKIDLISQSEFDQREMIDAATRIDIEKLESVGPKLAEKLIKAGLETVEDVYKASVEDLLAINGVGEKTAERLKDIAEVAYNEAKKLAEEARRAAEEEERAKAEAAEAAKAAAAEEAARAAAAAEAARAAAEEAAAIAEAEEAEADTESAPEDSEAPGEEPGTDEEEEPGTGEEAEQADEEAEQAGEETEQAGEEAPPKPVGAGDQETPADDAEGDAGAEEVPEPAEPGTGDDAK
jgi:N utilization substance protein A